MSKVGFRVSTELVKGTVRSPHNSARALRIAADHLSGLNYEMSLTIPFLPTEITEEIFGQPFIAAPRNTMELGNQLLGGIEALVGLGRLVTAHTAFEIGTYNGTTAWSLAVNLPGSIVDTLDLPPEDAPALRFRKVEQIHRIDFPRRTYEILKGGETVRQHFGDSAVFDFSPWKGTCDLVYIDGAHSLEYVLSDTRNALAMASKRSVIIWDDVWHREPEVLVGLKQFPDLELFRVPGTRLVCHFPGGITRIRNAD